MPSEQFQQMFMTWLAREDAQQALWILIVNAEVEDRGAATLAWQQELTELSPEQRTEGVMELLANNPSILGDFARQLMGSMALGLGETALRLDRAEGAVPFQDGASREGASDLRRRPSPRQSRWWRQASRAVRRVLSPDQGQGHQPILADQVARFTA
ncbi:hypothetical protein ACM9HC_29625 [Streptomyces sp. JAC18]|uniref:hypothetical protein n=1 Tax=Streptomyces sp. JAC18 TaxID=3418414 RepID=UPI003D813036